MLMSCPRCGFQQPQDKYCAQCGVDVESYKPAVIPPWKRLAGNPIVQLSLLILITGLVGGALYRHSQSRFLRQGTASRPSLQVSASSSFTSTEKKNSPSFEEPSPPSSQPVNPAEGTVNAYKVTPPSAPAASATPPARGTSPHVLVYYTEVNQDYLNGLLSSSRNAGQFMDFGEYSAGLLPNIGKILVAPQVKVLHKEVRSLESNKSLHWFYGLKSSKESELEYGLTTSLGINDIENKVLRGTVEIQRSWREPQGAGLELTKKTFPAEFEIDDESGFFVSGLMPRRSYLDNDRELFNIDIYKILSSPQFRSGESNFVIFIDFDNGN